MDRVVVVDYTSLTFHIILSTSHQTQDESDEEESTAYRPTNIDANGELFDPNDPSNTTSTTNKATKKKKRWRRNDPRPKRWVLQEKAEFFERVAAKRRRKLGSVSGDEDNNDGGGSKLSNQYHGVAEANSSKYVILTVDPTSLSTSGSSDNNNPSAKVATEQITIQPIYGFHTFSQPYKTASLTMEEAEDAIEQQRNVVTRYMMHGRHSNAASDKKEAAAQLASGISVAAGGRGGNRPIGPPPKAMSRARLLGRLAGNGDVNAEDEEDVMADIKFSTSRGGSSRARKELLSSMADEGITVDDDGVLGGANDSEFGGRRRFANVAVDKSGDGYDATKSGGKGGAKGGTATGFEAGAMEEGFYQRDVSAEYEALDYDANEQFDDDDVNLGENEIQDDGGGFGGRYDDSDDMFDSSDEDIDDDVFKGIASSSGLKAMLAKARGESPVNTAPDGSAAASDGLDGSGRGDEGSEGINAMLDAAKKTAEEMEKKKTDSATGDADQKATSPKADVKAVGIEKDKEGRRLITMEAIRREIWLNNGAIKSKRLMKKFDVTNKTPERQALFKSIVMELCTMKKDADGNKLVLKQHYSKSS